MIPIPLARFLAPVAIGMLLIASASTSAVAQTPIPNSAPKLTLAWLSSVGVSPSSVIVTQTTSAQLTGTVTLLRAAVSPLTVSFSLTGAALDESNVLAGDGNVMPASIVIPAGKSSGSFTIYVNKAPSWTSKTFTLGAAYGSERKTTSFTVTKR